MKTIFSAFLAFALSQTLCAQKISKDKLPSAVKEAFQKAHPSATATWEWEDKAYEANFKEGGKEMSCIITREGVITETETEMKLTELPQSIQDYVAKNYSGKKITETAKIVIAGGAVTYEVATAGKELIFDAAGKLKEQKTEKQ